MSDNVVSGISTLDEGEMRAVQVEGRDVLIARVEGRIYAVQGICSHAHGYLDEGDLEGFRLLCPLHEGSFDIRTGTALTAPATQPLSTFHVTIEDDQIRIDLSRSSDSAGAGDHG
ncbi:MAG: naphthalene 1,2-dioxygenase [Alphaproteobacteria bacterium]|nr:naphthalene 1,2-dioxygenase [Alphaproteobacteria bacterium]